MRYQFVLSNWPEVINLKVNNFINRQWLLKSGFESPSLESFGIMYVIILEMIMLLKKTWLFFPDSLERQP